MIGTILAWTGALGIGISLGMLGSGGSVLTVPVLVYLFGQNEKVAIAGSLFIVGAIAAAGSLQFLRSGQVDWRSVLTFGLPGIAGTWLGAQLAAYVPGTLQLVAFALVMFVAAWLMLRPLDLSARQAAPRAAWRIALDGLAVGVVTGLVGVGGGFLIVPALVLLGGLQMHRAVATSLVIIALKSFAGFIKYLDVLEQQDLQLDWPTIALVTLIGVAGSIAGRTFGKRLSQEKLKTGFGIFLVAMGIYIIARSGPELLGLF
jgi:uncharacterized membrane protein YfcA